MDRKTSAFILVAVVVICSFISRVECLTSITTTPPTTTPPPPPPAPCTSHTSCDTCVQTAKCLWCFTNNTCTDYPVSYLLPPPSVCQLSQARWGVCWVNFEALLIAMAVVGGTILIGITVCCCCCCCCKRRQSGLDRDDERFSRRREEIRQRSDERKEERKTRHDEIRKKYGLITDSDHPYSKFENE